jgi:hypothetical protein
MARHQETCGKTPATIKTIKMTAAATAQVSREKRGAFGELVVVDIVRAPSERVRT